MARGYCGAMLLVAALVLSLLLLLPGTSGLHQPIKINQPVNLGDTSTSKTNARSSQAYKSHRPLVPARPPSPFALPPLVADSGGVGDGDHWVALSHTCYHRTDSEYEYIACPYHNITQTSRTSTLTVLLGIYDAIAVTDTVTDTVTMMYRNGTDCGGGKQRSTVLRFQCSDSMYEQNRRWQLWLGAESDAVADAGGDGASASVEQLSEHASTYVGAIREPSVCEYEIEFYSPIVCLAYVRARLHTTSTEPTAADARTGGDGGGGGGGRDDEASLDCVASLLNPNIAFADARAICTPRVDEPTTDTDTETDTEPTQPAYLG